MKTVFLIPSRLVSNGRSTFLLGPHQVDGKIKKDEKTKMNQSFFYDPTGIRRGL
jgi:hypothetical protein